jgi:hypothetical protein
VRRDSTATVVAANDHGHLRLIVNGQGMTYLTPITKMMAHLPLASLDHPPANGLVICFGMGTTFRSMASGASRRPSPSWFAACPAPSASSTPLADDHPVNEYFILRRLQNRRRHRH